MPRKTSTRRVGKGTTSKAKNKAASATKKAAKPKQVKAKPAKKAQKATRRGAASTVSKKSTSAARGLTSRKTKRTPTVKKAARKPVVKKTPAVGRKIETPTVQPDDVLARAEADITAAIDSLNNRMNQAVTSLTELAVAQRGPQEAVVRTAPLDRATATFQRLIREVVDDQLAEMLPPLIALRNEMASYEGCSDSGDDTLSSRGRETIDQILAGADVLPFHPRVGETFDPLIHLAVGESSREDLPDGAVTEAFQPGFRSARGKVFQTARVKVNRR